MALKACDRKKNYSIFELVILNVIATFEEAYSMQSIDMNETNTVNNNLDEIRFVEPMDMIAQQVTLFLNIYLLQQNGRYLEKLYDVLLKHIELPLLKLILEYTDENQKLAAQYLGISRCTLRRKLKQYGLLA